LGFLELDPNHVMFTDEVWVCSREHGKVYITMWDSEECSLENKEEDGMDVLELGGWRKARTSYFLE